MSCRNTDLIFDLRRRITELQRANEGLETAIRLQAAGATEHIECLQQRIDILASQLRALADEMRDSQGTGSHVARIFGNRLDSLLSAHGCESDARRAGHGF